MTPEILDNLTNRVAYLSDQPAEAMARGAIELESDIRFHLSRAEAEAEAAEGAYIARLVAEQPKGLGASEWKATAAYRGSPDYINRAHNLRRLRGLLRSVDHMRAVALALLGRQP